MAERDTIIRIGMDADLSGGIQTEKQLDALTAKAKQLGKESENSAGKASSAFGSLGKTIGRTRQLLSGFGVVAGVTALIGAINKVKDSFAAAKKEADALAAAKAKAEHKEAVDALAKSYVALGEAAKNAAAALQHQNELLDISVKNARDLEDAQLNLAEQKELAAVDGNDLAASEARAQISARYAQRRGALAASRGKEDVAYQRQRLQGEADAKRRDAAGIEGTIANDDRVIAEARRRLADAQTRSVSENDADATGVMAGWGNNLKNIFTGNWGKVGDSRTVEGDAERAKAKAEVEELEAEIKQLQEQKAAKLKEAERLRQEAARAEEKKDALGGQIAVSDVRRETADVAGQAGVAAADRAREKKEAQIARDEKTVREGQSRIAELGSAMDSEKARAQAAADAYAREGADVVAAQGRYDMLTANGGSRKERSAALAALQKEQAEAKEAKFEMEKVAAEVATTLKAIKEQINALKSAVKSANSRLGQNQADAPEG